MAIRARSETKLLDAADELLFSRGIAATSIDAILDRAGVSTATLYRGFASKEALVAAALQRRHLAWIDVWDRAVDREPTARGRLLAVFDALEEFQTRPDGSRWCAFLGAAAEYSDPPPVIVDAVETDTQTFRDRLTGLAVPLAGERAAADLAEQLLLVITGSLAMRLRDPAHRTSTARTVAEALLGPAGLPRASSDGTASIRY